MACDFVKGLDFGLGHTLGKTMAVWASTSDLVSLSLGFALSGHSCGAGVWLMSVTSCPPPWPSCLSLVTTTATNTLFSGITSSLTLYEGCQVFDYESSWLWESNFFNIQIFVYKGKDTQDGFALRGKNRHVSATPGTAGDSRAPRYCWARSLLIKLRLAESLTIKVLSPLRPYEERKGETFRKTLGKICIFMRNSTIFFAL